MRSTLVPRTSKTARRRASRSAAGRVRDAARRELGPGLRARAAGVRAGADRPLRRGCRPPPPGAAMDGDADAARDEQHRHDCQQPPARVSAHPAPTGVECAAARRRRRALRGQLEARVDHHEPGELRAEHDAVGVADAGERAAARDDEHAGADQEVGERRARGAAASARCRRAARSCRAC